jgi:hypothetical protein
MDIQRFERDSTIPPTHQARYRLNPNYVITIKQDFDKLLVAGFIQSVKEATWLLPIVVVPKKNGKLKIYIDFKKLNAAKKKHPYPLPFTNEVLNIVAKYEAYSFLDGYSRYHQISVASKTQDCICYRLGVFYMESDVLELKMDLQHIKKLLQSIQRIFGQFYENNYG